MALSLPAVSDPSAHGRNGFSAHGRRDPSAHGQNDLSTPARSDLSAHARNLFLAGLVLATMGGCADLAFVPEQVPASLELSPADTLVVVGDVVDYRLVVRDQNGDSIRPPPAWARPVWSTSSDASVRMSPDGRAEALRGADASVSVSVSGLSARARLRINPPSLVLNAPVVHLTQGIQQGNGIVPLIAGRQALLRVFVTGDQVSFYRPQVHALFWEGDILVHDVAMRAESAVLPDFVDEGRLDQSYNTLVPSELLQPGLAMAVEINRDGSVPLAPGSTLRVPARGRTRLDVRALAKLDLTVVPIFIESDSSSLVLAWTHDIGPDSEHLYLTRSALPVGDLSVRVREPFTTSVDLTTGAGWGKLLGDLTFLHKREGERGYYYGAVSTPPGASWTGLGYIGGFRVSVGEPNGATLAHELGHNFGLHHAPCGGAASPDRGFPYDGGSIGAWGYDFQANRLVDPAVFKDVMGYCYPTWVSDYHFSKAMRYRLETEGSAAAGGRTADDAAHGALNGQPPVDDPAQAGHDRHPVDGAAQVIHGQSPWALREGGTWRTKSLVLRGSTGDGKLQLEPAFLMEMTPSMPSQRGSYRLDGYGSRGERRFSFSFSANPVEFGGGRFFFAVPYDPAQDGALAQVALSGPDGFFVLEASGAAPVAVVTDRTTGRVRAILRDWTNGRPGLAGFLDGSAEVTVSDGLPPEVATPEPHDGN